MFVIATLSLQLYSQNFLRNFSHNL